MERLVDVTYRGLRVARGAKLAMGGEQGFVELEAPLPVGTRVTVAGEGDFRVEARVVGVVEQDGASKATAGMRLDWAPPRSEAGSTMEIDPETDALVDTSLEIAGDEPGSSGSMNAVDESTTSTSPAGETRSGRRRRKKGPGRT